MTMQPYTATATRYGEKEQCQVITGRSLLHAKRKATKLWPYDMGYSLTIWNDQGRPVAKRHPYSLGWSTLGCHKPTH